MSIAKDESRSILTRFVIFSRIAQQNNLVAKSFGKNASRHIVISAKLSPQVLRQKLLEGDTHLLEKYEIIPPPKQMLKKKMN